MKNDGSLIPRGVAFHSSRAEPFGEAFLRQAVTHLLVGDVGGVREAYVDTLDGLRHREIPTRDVSSRVRLTKTRGEYLAVRESRRELPYEAMLAAEPCRQGACFVIRLPAAHYETDGFRLTPHAREFAGLAE